MPWRTNVPPDLPIIETIYSGFLTPSELFAAVSETLALVRVHGKTLLLGDCTALEVGNSSLDLFQAADLFLSSGISRTLKEAILVPSLPIAVQSVQLWETMCLNRGLHVRLFQDRQTALDWLLEK